MRFSNVKKGGGGQDLKGIFLAAERGRRGTQQAKRGGFQQTKGERFQQFLRRIFNA